MAREYPDRPVVGIGGVVIENGRALLIKRGSEPLLGQWSIPGGTLELGESLQEGVARELLEETGYSARSWKRVLRFWASPGFVAEAMSIYLARDLRAGAAQPEDDEVIEMKLVPLERAVGMVMNGTIEDAKTIAGVLWLERKVTLGRKRST